MSFDIWGIKMTYKVSVVVDIDDEDKLGEAAVAKLKARWKV